MPQTALHAKDHARDRVAGVHPHRARPVLDAEDATDASSRMEPAVTAALLFLFFLVPLWLTRGTFLINWDSVQFALGVERFDLSAHQPHPPGYIGYQVLGGWIASLTGDVPAALTLLSVVTGALAPAFLYLLARRMLARPYAIASAVLFGFSPLLWHYSGVALTYAPEVALSLPFVLLVHRADNGGRPRDLYGAALAFAVLGSVRQSALIMLVPLWLLALRSHGRRTQIGATAALVGACLVWAIPLVWGSGGPAAYLSEAADLAGLAVARTAFATASITGVLQNVGILAIGIFVGMHVTLIVPGVARRKARESVAGPRSPGGLSRSDRRFLLIWVVVPILFFVGIHTGQPGYALILLPAGYIWVASALAEMLGAAEARSGPRERRSLVKIVGGLAVVGVVTMLALPEAAYRLAASEPAARLQQQLGIRTPADLTGADVGVAAQSPLANALRQYSVPRNDTYWQSLVEFIDSYPRERVAVITGIGGPIASGSFRQLGYYLPSYRVYGVGWDRGGSFGYLFRSRNRVSNYSVRGLDQASAVLDLPQGVDVLIVPDADVAGLLDDSSLDAERWDLDGGASVAVVRVPTGSALELGNERRQAHIRLRSEVRRGELARTEREPTVAAYRGAGAARRLRPDGPRQVQAQLPTFRSDQR